MNRFLIATALTVLGVCASSQAALMVDFGNGSTPTEAGFTAFSLTNATNFAGSTLDVAGTGIDNGTDVRVTIDTDTPGALAAKQRLVPRNTAGWTGGLNDLLVDWVGMDNRPANGVPDTIVRLDNLLAGTYSIRSYHTDIGTGGNQDGQFDFIIDGVLKEANFQLLGQAATNSTTVPNFIDATFVADGTSTVDLTYYMRTNAGATGFAALNGFEVVRIGDAPTDFVPLNIINGSFEDPVVGDGGFSDTDPTGWLANNDDGAGPGGRVTTMDERRDQVNDTPEGFQMAHIQGDGTQMGQLLGELVDLGDREILLDYMVTKRTNEGTNVDHMVHLIAGDASTYVGGDILDTATFDTLLPASDRFLAASFSLLPTGVTANSHLWLVFESDQTGQMFIDSVTARIAAPPVPEPTTALLGLMGLMGLAGLASRRRRAA